MGFFLWTQGKGEGMTDNQHATQRVFALCSLSNPIMLLLLLCAGEIMDSQWVNGPREESNIGVRLVYLLFSPRRHQVFVALTRQRSICANRLSESLMTLFIFNCVSGWVHVCHWFCATLTLFCFAESVCLPPQKEVETLMQLTFRVINPTQEGFPTHDFTCC